MLILGLKGLSARDHRLLLEHCLKYVKNLSFSQPFQTISKKRQKRQEKQLFPFCAFRAKLAVLPKVLIVSVHKL